MELVTTITDLKQRVRPRRRAGLQVGFVPTMGYLHEGHLALVRRARAECDYVVASVFVNPLQFGPQEDFGRYPRDLERDAALLRASGCDVLFAPDVTEMYPQALRTFVEPTHLTDHLCGASRPGHFRGVATVVTKLFNIVEADAAYFGEKDAQQLTIIRRMVADLNMNIVVVNVPTLREESGLAMSSRNAYLSPEQRQAAAVLSRALRLAADLISQGERDAAAVTGAMRDLIAAEPLARVEYASAVDADNLQPLTQLQGRVLVALAVFVGSTRLIDNLTLEVVPVAAHPVQKQDPPGDRNRGEPELHGFHHH